MKLGKYSLASLSMMFMLMSQSAFALTVAFTTWTGGVRQYHLDTTNQFVNSNIGVGDIVKNCGGGSTTITIYRDSPNEEKQSYSIGFAGRDWSFSPDIVTLATTDHVKQSYGNARWCGNIGVTAIQN